MAKNKKVGKGSMSARDLGRILKRHGFMVVQQGKGSHGKIVDRHGNTVSTIVVHRTRLLSKAFIGTVVKQCGLDPQDVFA